MPSAYVIANVTVTNPVQYEDCKIWSSAAMQAHGAEVCVRGGAVQVVEGDWSPERLVVRPADLQSVFLRLTGRGMRDG
ncbi:MAG: DUF1330 domain-containing protein [Planctomycetes bacterium]|nr:DUF1330 domain-containing protein [Planctomycetota bacterium]